MMKSKSRQRILGSSAQYARLPFSSFLQVQQELRINKVDFNLQVPHLWCDENMWENTDHIKKQLQDAGIGVEIVTPKAYKYSICAGGSSPQGRATRAYYKNCFDVASSLQAPYVVITAEGACWDVERETLLRSAHRTLHFLSEEAGKRGITLLLASVLGDESPLRSQAPVLNHLEQVKEMVNQVDSPHLKVMLDIHVASVMGESITQWFESFGSEIKAVRFSDGNYNGYRVWGEGCFPGRRFLKELDLVGYSGPLSLHMGGERYLDSPEEADRKNVKAVLGFLGEET